MEKAKKNIATELNEHDKKILDKYAGYYSNFIESNTAENPMLEKGKRKIQE